jgi:Family of unknown function (DUF6174)
MLCTISSMNSWTTAVLLLCLCISRAVMPVPVATMMKMHDGNLRSRHHFGYHHHAQNNNNNIAKVWNANSPVWSAPRSLQEEVTTRNRTRPDDDGCDSGWEKKLEDHRFNRQEVWTDPNCYSYELELSCSCAPEYTRPIRIEVVNDTVVSVEYVANVGDPTISAVPDDRQPQTMNMLYQKVNRDCFDACPDTGAQECTITYDGVNGNIESLYIDYSKLAADDELVSKRMAFFVC